MGLAFAAIPTILTHQSEQETFNIKQEAIMTAITKAGNIFSYVWDEQIASLENTEGSKVLDVTNGATAYNRYPDNTSSKRIGHFPGNNRRSFYTTIYYASSTLGMDANDAGLPDDMDDLIGTVTISGGTTSVHEFKDLYKLVTNIRYVQDTNVINPLTTGTSNIKEINISVQDSDGETIANIFGFSTNIGSQKLIIRSW
jgi:hypothetical protein